MYKIVLHTWYQEVGEQTEILDNKLFDSLIDAVLYLSTRIDYIEDFYPVEKIVIEYEK